MIVYIDDAIKAVNNGTATPDAYYAKSKLIATSKRGYERVTPEQGYEIVQSSWLTGNWSDAPSGHSEGEVLAEIEKLEKEHGKVYVIFTPTSNVFSTGYDVLVETGEPKLKAKNVGVKTKLIEYKDGWGVKYHATEVIRFNSTENTYAIDTGGWFTRTTKERINKYLPSPYYVYQKNFKFYLHTGKEDMEFDKPITIKV